MYTLMKSLPVKRFAATQLPVLLGALAIAELFYKFGSFLLEAIAFLATWFVLDLALSLLVVRTTDAEASARPNNT